MARRIWLLLLLPLAALSALTWEHRPLAVWHDQDLVLTVRCPFAPTAIDDRGAAAAVVAAGDGVWRVVAPAGPRASMHIAAGDQTLDLAVIDPAASDELRWAEDHLLESTGRHVVLRVQRRRVDADRRYGLFRWLGDEAPAALPLHWPVAVPWGASALVADCARPMPASGDRCLVVLDGEERLVGWRTEAFRQVLSWRVEAMIGQGLRPTLVQPLAPWVERAAAEPLWAQVRLVARTYGLDVVETFPLTDASYWMIDEGVIGRWLNARGRAALASVLASAGAVDPQIPADGRRAAGGGTAP